MLYGGPYPIHPILFPVPVYLMMTGRPKSWNLNKHVVTCDSILHSSLQIQVVASRVICKCKTDTITFIVIIDHHSLSYVILILCLEAGVG